MRTTAFARPFTVVFRVDVFGVARGGSGVEST
jgi:hypothetical protein